MPVQAIYRIHPMAYTILGKVLVLSSDIEQDPGDQVTRRWLLQSAGVPDRNAPHYCQGLGVD